MSQLYIIITTGDIIDLSPIPTIPISVITDFGLELESVRDFFYLAHSQGSLETQRSQRKILWVTEGRGSETQRETFITPPYRFWPWAGIGNVLIVVLAWIDNGWWILNCRKQLWAEIGNGGKGSGGGIEKGGKAPLDSLLFIIHKLLCRYSLDLSWRLIIDCHL